jgi:hypothetical protein
MKGRGGEGRDTSCIVILCFHFKNSLCVGLIATHYMSWIS